MSSKHHHVPVLSEEVQPGLAHRLLADVGGVLSALVRKGLNVRKGRHDEPHETASLVAHLGLLCGHSRDDLRSRWRSGSGDVVHASRRHAVQFEVLDVRVDERTLRLNVHNDAALFSGDALEEGRYLGPRWHQEGVRTGELHSSGWPPQRDFHGCRRQTWVLHHEVGGQAHRRGAAHEPLLGRWVLAGASSKAAQIAAGRDRPDRGRSELPPLEVRHEPPGGRKGGGSSARAKLRHARSAGRADVVRQARGFAARGTAFRRFTTACFRQ